MSSTESFVGGVLTGAAIALILSVAQCSQQNEAADRQIKLQQNKTDLQIRREGVKP